MRLVGQRSRVLPQMSDEFFALQHSSVRPLPRYGLSGIANRQSHGKLLSAISDNFELGEFYRSGDFYIEILP